MGLELVLELVAENAKIENREKPTFWWKLAFLFVWKIRTFQVNLISACCNMPFVKYRWWIDENQRSEKALGLYRGLWTLGMNDIIVVGEPFCIPLGWLLPLCGSSGRNSLVRKNQGCWIFEKGKDPYQQEVVCLLEFGRQSCSWWAKCRKLPYRHGTGSICSRWLSQPANPTLTAPYNDCQCSAESWYIGGYWLDR